MSSLYVPSVEDKASRLDAVYKFGVAVSQTPEAGERVVAVDDGHNGLELIATRAVQRNEVLMHYIGEL